MDLYEKFSQHYLISDLGFLNNLLAKLGVYGYSLTNNLDFLSALELSPMPTRGAFTFVLHSHLPYARLAGRWPHGEEWIHEAASETYIPLLNALYICGQRAFRSA